MAATTVTASNANTNPQTWQQIRDRKLRHQYHALHTPTEISVHVPDHYKCPTTGQPHHYPTAQPEIPLHKVAELLLSQHDYETTELPVSRLLFHLRAQNITASAVATAYIRRASIAHQLTSCLTEPLFNRALKRARYLDAYLARENRPFGPLHGLPVTVKDGFNVAGFDSSLGIASLCFKPAADDAPLVKLLESLGAVVIAKTNVPQTLASLDSINNIFGRVLNPSNPMLTAGGSSGGEGVVVAMKGSAVGFGTDIGGSIRIPAMCNGIVGFKPSVGRVPFGGQRSTSWADGDIGRVGVQAVAGPIARCVEDVRLVMNAISEQGWMYDEGVLPPPFPNKLLNGHGSRNQQARRQRGDGPRRGTRKLTIGVLRSDGNCALLPPIEKVMDEMVQTLRQRGHMFDVKVVEIPTPKAWTKSQNLVGRLMGIDGAQAMGAMLKETGEPLVPWMQNRFKTGKAADARKIAELQYARGKLEGEMRDAIWLKEDSQGRKTRVVDAIICPVAPHPIPLIEGYNAVGYTSSWVMFDYPAASLPVRDLVESDLELGFEQKGIPMSSWDTRCRDLWDEKKVDRKTYLGSKLSIQVVTNKLEDDRLIDVMSVLEQIIRTDTLARKSKGRRIAKM